jgi:S-adenosylmethionine/arginine decarboxylase-like enzyme
MAIYNKLYNTSVDEANGVLELQQPLSTAVHYTGLNINNKVQFG